MEAKYVRVPFDLELAKKITNGEVEGEIIDNYNDHYRLICFDFLDSKGQIIGLRKDKDYKETIFIFNENGYSQWGRDFSLFLKVPEYLTFKDGDVIAYDKYNTISIIQGDIKREGTRLFAHYYVDFYKNELSFYNIEIRKILNEARKATEEEKQKLIEALKRSDDPKAKEYLKRFFSINIPKDSNSSQIRKNYEFKPFDKVLIRDSDDEEWDINLFKRYVEGRNFLICVLMNISNSAYLTTNKRHIF